MAINRKKFLTDFGVRLIVAYAAFFAIYKLLEFSNILYFLEIAEAQIVFAIVSIFVENISLAGNAIYGIAFADGGTVNLRIDLVCSGIVPIFTFLALVLAVPIGKLQEKINPALCGMGILFLLNVLRIVAVIFVGVNIGKDAFDLWHLAILKFDLMAIVLLLFVICFKNLLKENSKI